MKLIWSPPILGWQYPMKDDGAGWYSYEDRRICIVFNPREKLLSLWSRDNHDVDFSPTNNGKPHTLEMANRFSRFVDYLRGKS